VAALHALLRSGLVLGGLLLLGVGIGDLVAGHSKVTQYEQLLRDTQPRLQRDPAALFPTASEGEERHHLAKSKVAFYQLLITFGQLLSATGFALVALGVLRHRLRAVRPASEFATRELTSRR
jgi:hypothetical protein